MKYRLTLITKDQNSFKIEIIGEFADHHDSIFESIELTDRLCSPWVIKFDRDRDRKRVNLIFNNNTQLNYKN